MRVNKATGNDVLGDVFKTVGICWPQNIDTIDKQQYISGDWGLKLQ